MPTINTFQFSINALQINHINNEKGNLNIIDIDITIGRKLFLPISIGFQTSSLKHAAAFFDTGADFPIITVTYLTKLFSEINQQQLFRYLRKADYQLKSITGHSIPVYGILTLYMSLPSIHNHSLVQFMVVDDVASSHPLIINAEVLGKFSISIDLGNSNTKFYLKNDPKTVIHSHYVSEIERNYCYSNKVTLLPKQFKTIFFLVSPVSPYVPGDNILLTQDYIPYLDQFNIKIIQ